MPLNKESNHIMTCVLRIFNVVSLFLLCRRIYRYPLVVRTQISSQQIRVLKWIVPLEFTGIEVADI